MGEVPVKTTHPSGTSKDIRKINVMKMKITITMKSTLRDKIQTFMMNFNDYTFN